MENETGKKNRLAGESSPYLLQHSHQPVDWFPWGEEALVKAKKEEKPIFLSIGYSACHWCHVMAHESFEDNNIAKFLNENFISIKVDREERPDLDHIYMQAVEALTGRGGWPLTVFLTSNGIPFFGGTYFPPQNKHGLPGFHHVIQVVKRAYMDNKADVEKQAEELQMALNSVYQEKGTSSQADDQLLDKAYEKLRKEFDHINGGFSSAPKFPEPIAVEFLLRSYMRTKDQDALKMVELVLTKMAGGGIYDQLGGGFHRYSTDNMWRIPHFEKMLYDNALISKLYIHAYQATKNAMYKVVACETLDYLIREMRSPNGAFYASQDADSEGSEGKYYVWTKQEIDDIAGAKEADLFNRHYDITEHGNYDGYNVLTVADGRKLETAQSILDMKKELLRVRERRIKPGMDEKVLASWNGMMISSLAEAAATFSNKEYLNAAINCAEFMTHSLSESGRLPHTYKDGNTRLLSFLEDYAFVIQGFLDLHAATWSIEWLNLAIKLADNMIDMFLSDKDRLLYDTVNDGEDLFMRPRNLVDGATPSGNSSAAMVLLRLFDLTGEHQYEDIAQRSLLQMKEKMASYPRGFANWLCVMDYYLSKRVEIAICGHRDTDGSEKILNTIYNSYLPNRVIAASDPDRIERAGGIMLLQDRGSVGGRTAVYICSNNTCKEPIIEVEKLTSELNSL